MTVNSTPAVLAKHLKKQASKPAANFVRQLIFRWSGSYDQKRKTALAQIANIWCEVFDCSQAPAWFQLNEEHKPECQLEMHWDPNKNNWIKQIPNSIIKGQLQAVFIICCTSMQYHLANKSIFNKQVTEPFQQIISEMLSDLCQPLDNSTLTETQLRVEQRISFLNKLALNNHFRERYNGHQYNHDIISQLPSLCISGLRRIIDTIESEKNRVFTLDYIKSIRTGLPNCIEQIYSYIYLFTSDEQVLKKPFTHITEYLNAHHENHYFAEYYRQHQKSPAGKLLLQAASTTSIDSHDAHPLSTDLRHTLPRWLQHEPEYMLIISNISQFISKIPRLRAIQQLVDMAHELSGYLGEFWSLDASHQHDEIIILMQLLTQSLEQLSISLNYIEQQVTKIRNLHTHCRLSEIESVRDQASEKIFSSISQLKSYAQSIQSIRKTVNGFRSHCSKLQQQFHDSLLSMIDQYPQANNHSEQKCHIINKQTETIDPKIKRLIDEYCANYADVNLSAMWQHQSSSVQSLHDKSLKLLTDYRRQCYWSISLFPLGITVGWPFNQKKKAMINQIIYAIHQHRIQNRPEKALLTDRQVNIHNATTKNQLKLRLFHQNSDLPAQDLIQFYHANTELSTHVLPTTPVKSL